MYSTRQVIERSWIHWKTKREHKAGHLSDQQRGEAISGLFVMCCDLFVCSQSDFVCKTYTNKLMSREVTVNLECINRRNILRDFVRGSIEVGRKGLAQKSIHSVLIIRIRVVLAKGDVHDDVL